MRMHIFSIVFLFAPLLLAQSAGLNKSLQSMLRSSGYGDATANNFLPVMRLSMSLSLIHYAHVGTKLLLLEPGANAKIVELSPGGEIQSLSVKLPDGEVADSILPAQSQWMIRAHPSGIDTISNLYEIDPVSGNAIREIRTSDVPATRIACWDGGGFYGLRWIKGKPYIITGSY